MYLSQSDKITIWLSFLNYRVLFLTRWTGPLVTVPELFRGLYICYSDLKHTI